MGIDFEKYDEARHGSVSYKRGQRSELAPLMSAVREAPQLYRSSANADTVRAKLYQGAGAFGMRVSVNKLCDGQWIVSDRTS